MLPPVKQFSFPIFQDDKINYWDVKFQVYIQRPLMQTISMAHFNYALIKLIDHLEKFIKPTYILSLDQVVLGDEMFDSMTVDTSPGYPFTEAYKTKLECLASPTVQNLIAFQWNNWLEEEPLCFPATMHSKDEILPLEKCKKPRPFYGVDVVSVVNQRRLCADFNNQFSGNEQSFFRAGCSNFGGQPEQRYNKHIQYKYHWGADAKHYDRDRKSWESLLCAYVRTHFMANKSSEISSRLLGMYSTHDQCQILSKDGKFYDHCYSMITGFYNTLEDNSMRTFCLIHLIYHMNGIEFNGWIDIMGDDFVVSTDIYLSTEIIKQTAKTIGYQLVSPAKDEDADFYVPIFELQFLKTKFYPINGRIIATYEFDRMCATLNFKKSKDSSLEERLNSVMLMMFMTPMYYKIRLAMIDMVRDNILRADKILTHSDCMKVVYNYESRGSAGKINHLEKYYSVNTKQIKTNNQIKLLINNKTAQSKMSDSMPVQSDTALPGTNQDMFQKLRESEVYTETVPMNQYQVSTLVKKLVHPPSDVTYTGLPSGAVRSQVCMEIKGLKLNNPPLIVGPDNNLKIDANPEKIAPTILVLNGPRAAAVSFVYDNNFGYDYQDEGTVYYNDAFNFQTWSENVNVFRMNYKSTTVSLNATAFNNTGIVSASQFVPAILFGGALVDFFSSNRTAALDFLTQQFVKRTKVADIPDFHIIGTYPIPERDIHAYKLVTKEHPHYKEYHDGWLQFPRSVRLDIIDVLSKTPKWKELKADIRERDGHVLSMLPNAPIQILNLNKVGYQIGASISTCPTTNQVVNVAKSYSGAARDGCFMVQRLTQPLVNWVPACRADTPAQSPPRLFACFIYTTFGGSYIPLFEQATAGTAPGSGGILLDAPWTSDMTMGWIKFDGLALNSTVTAKTTDQLLIVKTITGLEFQAATGGAFSCLTKQSPDHDDRVMESVMNIQADFKDGMPAYYNSWAMLAQLAGTAVTKLAPHLINYFTKNPLGGKKQPTAKKAIKKEAKQVAKKEAKKEVKREMPSRPRQRPPRPPRKVHSATYVNKKHVPEEEVIVVEKPRRTAEATTAPRSRRRRNSQ